MLDSQKIALEEFLLGYKHGVYVFTRDACQSCQDYKREIEYINNCYLYFVEVSTEQEISIVNKIIDRQTFPQTVAYLDNEIKFIRPGILFEESWKEIDKFLKTFGDVPLPDDEVERRIERQKNRCLLTYYILPSDLTSSEKEQILNSAVTYNELPIDVDSLCPTLPNEERERMLEGSYHFAKLVYWRRKESTNLFNYTSFSQNILLGYTNINQEVKFITRDIEEVIL